MKIESWTKVFSFLSDLSGKELIVALVPVLLIVPGVLDELIVAAIIFVLAAPYLAFRFYVIHQREAFLTMIDSAEVSGRISKERANEARHDLNHITVGR
ncbi:MAG: hypothetical protein QNJ09_11435 [Paracoccaceae bacterium]|nr:hypothetical protein [Paracoccaceae bacterium]